MLIPIWYLYKNNMCVLFLGQRTLPESVAGGFIWPPGGSRNVPVSRQTYASPTPRCFIHEDVSLALCLSSDSVDIEHEVFKSSKSSNLYKASILKKVTADLSVTSDEGRWLH